MKTFANLGLTENLLRAVKDKGYEMPSPIQVRAIPAILTGKDILAAAQTGTGKTAGFTLPMVQILDQTVSDGGRPIRALVLTPTRELAAQVQESIKAYGKYLTLKSMVVFGGVNIKPQIDQLKKGVDILVATPGRLLDLCSQKACRLNQVNMLVLDEADRMLDMGFIHDIRRVIKLLPPKRQTLLFSATFSTEIRAMTREFLVKPTTIEVTPEYKAAQTVSQCAYRCDAKAKTSLVTHLINEGNWAQVLIFTRTKHGANRLSVKLAQAGIKTNAIHGNKTQPSRIKALDDLKKRKIRVLVATDIAARGLDIIQLPHVVNYDLPNVPEDYVHRIGRTGRAGMEGEAISLVCNEERAFLRGIEKLTGQSIKLLDVSGFEPTIWPRRAPTASEVQKTAAIRKETARQARGPRRQTATRTSTRESTATGKKPSRSGNQKRKFPGGKG